MKYLKHNYRLVPIAMITYLLEHSSLWSGVCVHTISLGGPPPSRPLDVLIFIPHNVEHVHGTHVLDTVHASRLALNQTLAHAPSPQPCI